VVAVDRIVGHSRFKGTGTTASLASRKYTNSIGQFWLMKNYVRDIIASFKTEANRKMYMHSLLILSNMSTLWR